jgi:hypothetical protein
MHLRLVTDTTPEWIIGEDAAAGDAWMIHTQLPRFAARVCHRSAVSEGEPHIRLGCGLALADLRWLSVPDRHTDLDELILRADRVLGEWLQRQITRASRAA